MESDLNEQRYKWYLDRVKEARERAQNIDERLDHSILTVASSALGLSFTFLGALEATGSVSYLAVLGLAWLLLLGCLAANMSTMHLAIRASDNYKEQLDNWYKSRAPEAPRIRNRYGPLAQTLQYSSYATLVLGLVLIVIFTFLNATINTHESSKWPAGVHIREDQWAGEPTAHADTARGSGKPSQGQYSGGE